MKTRKLLGMLTMALGLTMITVVICDIRNPMMSFLIGRAAQVYILLISVCAVMCGVVLIRDFLLAEGEAKEKPAGEAEKKDRAEKKEPALAKRRETVPAPAAETARNPAPRNADSGAGRKTAPVEKKNLPSAPEKTAEMPKSAPAAKTGTAEKNVPAPASAKRSPEAAGNAPSKTKSGTVSLSAAENGSVQHTPVTEFSLEDILSEDW